MSNNRCDRCGRPIKDPNAKYDWRCAEIIAAGGSLTIDLSAIFSMLEKYTDFSFESQNDLFDISEIFEKILTLSSAPYSMKAENNPDTNDTAEDSIDELFGNIPLYHYLNTVFAKTEAEFEDSLMKGLNALYDAFMNLPYTSLIMGDIAVAEPQNAFAHEPYVSQFNIPGKNIKISDSQFGKKLENMLKTLV